METQLTTVKCVEELLNGMINYYGFKKFQVIQIPEMNGMQLRINLNYRDLSSTDSFVSKVLDLVQDFRDSEYIKAIYENNKKETDRLENELSRVREDLREYKKYKEFYELQRGLK